MQRSKEKKHFRIHSIIHICDFRLNNGRETTFVVDGVGFSIYRLSLQLKKLNTIAIQYGFEL